MLISRKQDQRLEPSSQGKDQMENRTAVNLVARGRVLIVHLPFGNDENKFGGDISRGKMLQK